MHFPTCHRRESSLCQEMMAASTFRRILLVFALTKQLPGECIQKFQGQEQAGRAECSVSNLEGDECKPLVALQKSEKVAARHVRGRIVRRLLGIEDAGSLSIPRQRRGVSRRWRQLNVRIWDKIVHLRGLFFRPQSWANEDLANKFPLVVTPLPVATNLSAVESEPMMMMGIPFRFLCVQGEIRLQPP